MLRRLGTRGPGRARGYVVCATPRCGSNYLCQLLASTGVLGDPREYFNPTGRRHYDDDPGYPDDPRAQVARVLSGASANGVWAVKIHPFQLGELGDLDPWAELPQPHVVRMRREDRLGQALSWARAERTGRFRASDPADPGADPAPYDRDAISAALEFLAGQEAEWDRRLAGHELPTLTLTYEELVADPRATVARVAGLVGVRDRVTVDPGQVTVAVQRDAVTEEWRRRYLEG